ncbi:hypothetical protein [Kitasatospora purpeofusca]|uniref:hypothetical protein n=1 Tax=Kitasatospora purpeofusca TaxID=67352 RepID=UPI003866B530|nr:hypothetical protein OIP63_04760 [Kitasatospora purpeofusca]
MSMLSTVATLRATQTGRAQPLATVRHQHLDTQPFALVPLTLAGEACAPLAALVGTDPEHPVLLTVRQPRDRALRFRFVEELAALLLPYAEERLDETETYTTGRGKNTEERERARRGPQLLVPNGEGIAYVRRLGRLTRLRGTDGPHAVHPDVPMLGKWLTWFADQAEFPGASTMLAVSRVLTAHWATGQSSAEDSHLAAVVAWIDPPEGRTGPEAARETENPLLWPPAGPATDAGFDGILDDLITRYSEAEGRVREGLGERIDRTLYEQLRPTWDLVWRGVGLARSLPEGSHVEERWAFDRRLFSDYAAYLREHGHPQGKRDRAVSAARRLARLEDAVSRYQTQRAYDDPLVMAEYELTGEAFSGTVVARDEDRFLPGAKSPLWRPTITVHTERPVRLMVGTTVKSPGRPRQPAEIIDITSYDEAHLVTLQLSGGFASKRKPPAPEGTLAEIGEAVTYTELDLDSVLAKLPAEEDTPWTHGGPPSPYEPTTADAEEEWA